MAQAAGLKPGSDMVGGMTAATELLLVDPQALIGLPAEDPRRGPVGTVTAVETAGRHRVRALMVRKSGGDLVRIEQDRVYGFDAGRVLVRSG